MHFRTLSALASFVSFVALTSTTVPAAAAPERLYDVTGVVKARLDDGQLVIKHDPIPGFMAAMTMAFTLSDPAEGAKMKPGDQVRFRLRVTETAANAEGFVVTGHTAQAIEAGKPNPSARSSRLRAGDAVPAFQLLDEAGRPFTSDDLRERLTVVTFIFTRCPVPEYCPAMAVKFGALQKAVLAAPALATRVRLVSVSLDPEFDRPEILAEYGKAVGAQPAVWNFATGEKASVDALAKAFAVFAERNGVTLDHTLCTALIGRDGRVLEIWRGSAWKNEEILAALAAATTR
jgi:protein SCO1